MLHALLASLRTPIAFLVTIGVLVFVHEFGHYAAARLTGCRVEAFSIGFGAALASWTDRAGTEWRLGWIPVGGYVRIHGFERPELMEAEARAALISGQSFQERSVGARALVAAAGPAANFLLTFLLFAGLFLAIGTPVPSATIGAVQPGSAAAHAGLVAGDRIVAVDGHAVAGFPAVQAAITPRPGQTIRITLARGAGTRDVTVTLGSVAGPGGAAEGRLGVASGAQEYVPAAPGVALAAAARESWSIVVQTADGLARLVAGRAHPSELGGALRIAQLSGQVSRLGAASFIGFIAVLSVNLGLLNLVPIPVLDGGHLLFLALEALRGRPVPARFYAWGMRAGVGVVAVLLLFSAVNDLSHFGLFTWLSGWVG